MVHIPDFLSSVTMSALKFMKLVAYHCNDDIPLLQDTVKLVCAMAQVQRVI